MKSYLARCFGMFLFLLALSVVPPADGSSRPFIHALQRTATNVTVQVTVPAGFKQVHLMSRTQTNAVWGLRAIRHIRNDSGASIVFRLSGQWNQHFFRVVGKTTDPLPKTFYRRQQSFPGTPVRFDWSRAPGFGTTGSPAAGEGAPGRVVRESDVWKIDGNRLYYFNQYRGLQIIDISSPDSASVIGAVDLPSVGEQMYLLDSAHVVLLARKNCDTTNYSSEIIVVNVASAEPAIVARRTVEGSILESRLVGTALYVASQTYRTLSADQWETGAVLSAFDLSNPVHPIARNQFWFPGYSPVIHATDEYFFLVTQDESNWWQSVVQCIAIGNANGTMEPRSAVSAAGHISDKFKINYANGILTLISQRTDWEVGDTDTKLETFSLADPFNVSPLGTLTIAPGEQLYATRFDSNCVYIVTFQQVDPLWIVDLSNPSSPQVQGHVEVPGWSTYIHPLGERLVTIGQDPTDGWRVAVSLFDVSDKANPALLSKVALGDNYSWSEASYDEKAFSVLPGEGLILVPFQGDSADEYATGVQLIDLGENTVTLRGRINHGFQPRRATVHADRILSVSGTEFLSVDARNRDNPIVRKELTLAWSVDRTILHKDYVLQLEEASYENIAPVIRVSSAASPNTLIRQWALTNRPIVGVTVRSNALYLLQSERSSYFGGGIISYGTESASTATLLMSVIDLTGLPELEVVGQLHITNSSPGYQRFQAVWPKTNLLVWASTGNDGMYWPMLSRVENTVRAASVKTSTVSLAEIMSLPVGARQWLPYGGTAAARLIAVNVADLTVPRLASDFSLRGASRYQDFVSATNGLVYLGHSRFEDEMVATIGGIARPELVVRSPAWGWRERFFLDVVDYSNSRQPLKRPSLNISGALRGISHSGNVIYTAAENVPDVTTGYANSSWRLDAFAYDGLQLFWIDSLPLGSRWKPPVAISGNEVFISRKVPTFDHQLDVGRWKLSDSGEFVMNASISVGALPDELAIADGLLAATFGTQLNLFNVSGDSITIVAHGSAPSCVWFNLNAAFIDRSYGIAVPLGDYGLWTVQASE